MTIHHTFCLSHFCCDTGVITKVNYVNLRFVSHQQCVPTSLQLFLLRVGSLFRAAKQKEES